MSKTRNQRRREQQARQFALMALAAILTAAVWISAVDIEGRVKNRAESAAGDLDGFLPEDFDENAYQAALDRYNVEEGLLLPQLTTEEAD